MTKDIPKGGTPEFSQYLRGHFDSLTDALKDLIGDDFGKFASIIMGVDSIGQDGKNMFQLFATGNVRNSIRCCAMILHTAAKNAVISEKISEEAAMMRMLEELRKDVMMYKGNIKDL